MKRAHWFWCGAAFFALATLVTSQNMPDQFFGIPSICCALLSAILLGFGLHANAREQTAAKQRLQEEHQARCEELRRIETAVASLHTQIRQISLESGQAQAAAVIEAIRNFQESAVPAGEQRLQALAQLLEAVQANTRTQARSEKTLQALSTALAKDHAALQAVWEAQGKDAAKYYNYMIDQPWSTLQALSENMQRMAEQNSSILDAIQELQLDTQKQLARAMKQLREDSEELHDRLQGVCTTLEQEGQESRNALDGVMQSYANITAQDLEVLEAFAKGRDGI